MKNVNKILDKLEEIYPDAQCELNYETPFELLIATILLSLIHILLILKKIAT